MDEVRQDRLVVGISMPDAINYEEPARRREGAVVRWWVAFSASTLLVVVSHLLMKAGLLGLAGSAPATNLQQRILSYFSQPALLEGLALYALASLFWMLAVAQKDVSFLYPLTSINYVLVVTASLFAFHEVVSLRRWLGVATIVLGVMLLNQTRSRGQ